MAGKRQARGPKCPVCRAVMYIPEGKTEPVCAHAGSHARIIKMRLRAAKQAEDTKRDQKKS